MNMEVAINTDTTQKFFENLEAERTILSSCTELFTTLTTHFTSLQNSLSQKSQSLDSKFQFLETNSKETLESLQQRETSIPERELAATARVQQQKEDAIAEFQKPPQLDNLSESLKSFARRMDSSGLLKFITFKRKESVSLRAEVFAAVMEAVDPAVLILDAVDEFVSNKIEKVGVSDKRWACGFVVQALYPEGGQFGRKLKSPEFGRSVVDRAGKILDRWMEELVDGGGSGGGGSGVYGPAEAVMFLQMVVIFGLKSRFDDKLLMKLVMDHASRRDMAKLAVAIGYGEKMEEMIEDLVKNGKEIEAVYFASESGLTEKFSPVSLIKSHISNSKRNSNSSATATDESNSTELNSIKAVIKCIEDHKLESDFSIDALRKQATRLEKTKSERKKSSASTTPKSKNKRPHASSTGRGQKPPAFRPAKAAKYSPFGPPAPVAQHTPAARYPGPYNYPSQSQSVAPPYPLTFGAPHSQTPAVVPPQQHYPLISAEIRPSSSYGVQANYVNYDYSSATPPVYQPPSYTQ